MKILMAIACCLVLGACAQGVKFGLQATSEDFAQNITYNNKVDFVWLVDNSQSMAKHQQTLNTQIPDLVSKLNAMKLDYHMVVITSSMGAGGDGGQFVGNPKVLTNTTADLTNILKQRIAVGEAGSNLERGMYSLETVLSNNYLNNQGSGFLREEALLVVNVLSDEDDQSGRNASYYEAMLDELKPAQYNNQKNWMLNFVGVLSPTAATGVCTTFNAYSDPGDLFIALANLSGGVQESICTTTLTSAVSNIRLRILQILTDFRLSSKPLLSSVRVKINGKVIPQSQTDGWYYIESLNVIRFYGTAVPAADAVIAVDFTPAQAS
ncbi:MAG: hypothetical protein ACOYOK_11360 [Pseudobdellovibrionaceae bacterium]